MAWSCFVAIPATQAYLRDTIREALEASGIDAMKAEDLGDTSLPVKMIQRADLMIADLTGSNPYIFYELGVADALRKPVLLIVQRPATIPGDFAGHKLVIYGPEEVEKLSGFIRYWARDALESSAGPWVASTTLSK